jgi:hypothetical protein
MKDTLVGMKVLKDALEISQEMILFIAHLKGRGYKGTSLTTTKPE